MAKMVISESRSGITFAALQNNLSIQRDLNTRRLGKRCLTAKSRGAKSYINIEKEVKNTFGLEDTFDIQSSNKHDMYKAQHRTMQVLKHERDKTNIKKCKQHTCTSIAPLLAQSSYERHHLVKASLLRQCFLNNPHHNHIRSFHHHLSTHHPNSCLTQSRSLCPQHSQHQQHQHQHHQQQRYHHYHQQQRYHHYHQQRHRQQTSAETCFLQWCTEETSKLKQQGTYRHHPSSINVQPPYISFTDTPPQSKLLNFTSYDYLGLADDRDVLSAYVSGLGEHVSHVQPIRPASKGIKECTLDLETRIAAFHRKEACFSYASVSEVMSALFYSVYGGGGVVLADEYNTIYHRGGQVEVIKYKHTDIKDLARKLYESKATGRKVIVTDGVFSQTGEVAPLRDIMEVAEEANATVLLNDTHGIGCVGEGLRGSESELRLCGQYDNLLTTCKLGYGLGPIVGGYMVGSAKTLHDHVTAMTSHPMYTMDLSAAACAAIATIIGKLPALSSQARMNRQRGTDLKESLEELGLIVKGGDHPIVSIAINKTKIARSFANKLKELGHVVSVITDPQLLLGDTHIRFILTSSHTDSHVRTLVDDVSHALDLMKNHCVKSSRSDMSPKNSCEFLH